MPNVKNLILMVFLLVSSTAHAQWDFAKTGGKCLGLSFVDSKVGVAIWDKLLSQEVVKTTDGVNWSLVKSTGFPMLKTITAIKMLDPMKGYVLTGGAFAMSDSALFGTSDGGATWKPAPITLAGGGTGNTWLTGISFATPMDGAVVALFGLARGFVAITSDGGASWKEVSPPDKSFSLGGVAMLSPQRIVVSGVYKPGADGLPAVWSSGDGGKTWTLRFMTRPFNSVANLDFVSATTGYFFHRCNGINAMVNECVMKTTDGGDTWTSPGGAFIGDTFSSMAFADEMNGLLVGDDKGVALVLRTTDGAKTWKKETTPAKSVAPSVVQYPGPLACAANAAAGADWICNVTEGGGPKPVYLGGAVMPPTDGGVPPGADAGALPDGGAGTSDMASATPGDAASMAAPDLAAGGDSGSGCSVSSRRAPSAPFGPIALLACGLLLVRRRAGRCR